MVNQLVNFAVESQNTKIVLAQKLHSFSYTRSLKIAFHFRISTETHRTEDLKLSIRMAVDL